MKAVVPVAGLGSRFLPYTKSQPKEMPPVVDKPAIQYVIEEAVAAGIRDIVTGRGKRAIEDHFDMQKDLGALYGWVFPGSRFDGRDRADWIRATIRLAMERPDLRDPVWRILAESLGETPKAGC